jgi:hypothetical protein
VTSPEVDIEDVVIAYLVAQGIAPATQVSARMAESPTFPFILVQRVAGGDDYLVDHSTVQVDSFHQTQTLASDTARAVHHVMRQLRAKTPVTMPDSSVVIPYGVTTTERTPIYMEWEPEGGGATLDRYVARYLIPLRLPSITSF